MWVARIQISRLEITDRFLLWAQYFVLSRTIECSAECNEGRDPIMNCSKTTICFKPLQGKLSFTDFELISNDTQ